MNKDLLDMSLWDILDHPEFISIERHFTRHDNFGLPVKDLEDPIGSPKMYMVTFESSTKASAPLRWLTCIGTEIVNRRYTFYTYFNKEKHGKVSKENLQQETDG